MASEAECCNPAAKGDQERCSGCPMRNEPNAKERAHAEPEPPKERKPAVPHSSLWQMLHDEFKR